MSKQQPTRSRGRGKTNSGQQGSSEPVAIEDLGSSNTIVVNTSPSTSPTLTTTAAPTTRIIVRSPEPIQYDELSSCQQSSSLESHTHEFSELSIGEQFGRRHGQDWPAGSFVRCASCPNGREKPRSHSRGRRRMSGVLYKAITPRPVLSAQSFQEARKSEEEIAAMKGKQVQEYYQSLVWMRYEHHNMYLDHQSIAQRELT
ncbi:hypothetical protein BC939DRAFT_134718 [Gamsiella multidivaricata]|uniref:uncharacterized protein n=1 Tax=Gamsiella multidivaricata TaxID=101098 RepID=UPI00221EC49F|nr:uncharacterized protein BC939DRAFT_134718 [Gamsiella multidivaricata]KAI7824777.1 hypothetical protein BC939DRAFT_134718 [Gamsiella multidivaricata]